MMWVLLVSFIFAQEPQSAPQQEPTIQQDSLDVESMPEGAVEGEEPFLEKSAESQSLVKRLTEPFLYDQEGKRDPFILPETRETPLLPGSYFGPFLPLQEIPLKQIVIKGIILDRIKSKAIIEYKDHKDKVKQDRVTVGDYLGENFGVIQAIQEGKIIVVQTLGEGSQKSTSTITLSIRK